MMEFLIGFNPGNVPIHISGGMLIIKKLVEILTEKNQIVYVLNQQYKTEKSHLITGEQLSKLDKNKVIVIYPEIVLENPFNMKNVVRWILYHPPIYIEQSWSNSDEYFYYNNFFSTQRVSKEKKILNCFYFNLENLYDMKLKRSGYCHINKIPRSVLSNELITKYNSEEISEGFNKYGYDWLRNKLNEKEYFITNDYATYYSVMAALCGCKSIVLDNKITEKEKENLIIHKYGIAFGFDDVTNAQKSLPNLKPYLQSIELESYASVDNLINFWKNKLK